MDHRNGFLIHAVLLIALQLLTLKFWKKRAAKNIHGDAKRLFSQLPDYHPVSAAAFPWIPKEFYNQTQLDFERRGFRFVADIEDANLSKQYPLMRTFIRSMLSPDGVTAAGIYEVKMRGWMRALQWFGVLDRKLRGIDLETGFEDGSFLCTCVLKESNLLRDTPGIVRRVLPPGTPIDEALRVHQAAIQDHAQESRPLVLSTLDDMCALQIRQRMLKNDHRQLTGYLTRVELMRTAGSKYAGTAAEVMDEIEKIAQ